VSYTRDVPRFPGALRTLLVFLLAKVAVLAYFAVIVPLG